MTFDLSNLLAILIFSIIGIAGWRYGRAIHSARKLAISAALCLYPYLVSNDYLLWAVGIALTCALIFWQEG